VPNRFDFERYRTLQYHSDDKVVRVMGHRTQEHIIRLHNNTFYNSIALCTAVHGVSRNTYLFSFSSLRVGERLLYCIV
jgi:hypothetical protein